jgi:pimeloyl-ACP methyl ester carboxylesterase
MGNCQVPAVNIHFLRVPARFHRTEQPEDLVLIHGLAANLAFWRTGVVIPLSRLFNVVVYDLRGHGRSSIPARGYSLEDHVGDLESLLDHLEIDRAHLLAHSYGGAIAILFALRQPQRVRSITLVDSRLRALQPQQRLADWRYWPKWRKVLLRAGVRLDDQDGEGGFRLLVELARLQTAKGNASTPQLPALFASAERGRARGSARRWLRLQEETSLFREFCYPDSIDIGALEQLRLPVKGIYGDQSNTLPTAYALERLCKDFSLEILHGVGHFFPIHHPKMLLRPVVRFLLDSSPTHAHSVEASRLHSVIFGDSSDDKASSALD